MLILKVCSVVHLNCLPPIHDSFVFNSWSECASAGYLRAIKTNNSALIEADKDMIEKHAKKAMFLYFYNRLPNEYKKLKIISIFLIVENFLLEILNYEVSIYQKTVNF